MENNNSPKRSSERIGPRLWQIAAVRDLMWIGIVLLLLVLAFYLQSILLPVFLGLVLAYLFNPTVTFIQKKIHIPKQVTIIFLLALAAALAAAAGVWLVPPLIDQGTNFVQSIPQYWKTLTDKYGIPLGDVPQNPGALLEKLDIKSGTIIPFFGSVIGTSVIILFWIILIPVSFFVFSMRFNKILNGVKQYIPLKHKELILRVLKRMDDAVGSFFRGRLLISLVISVLFSAGWFLVGVPYWFVLGVATGLLSIVPYLSTVGWFAAILVKYLEMTTGAQAPGFDFFAVLFWPTVIFQGVNVLEEYILTPWIQSKSTTLNPLTILIVVFIGGWVGGLFGLLFAIPVTACLKILWEEVFSPYLRKKARSV